MQHTAVFEEQVALTPRDMRREIDSIDAKLLEKLQAKLEGRCSRNGFVLPGTMKVLSRSMGVLEKGRFTGSILFHVQAEAEVLNPPDGVILEGEVIRKNKMGMYVSYNQDAVRVILPRDLHIGNEDFEAIQVGQKVRVEVKKSRFQVNDPYILSVGLFRGKATGAAAAAAPVVAAAPELPVPDLSEDEEEETDDEDVLDVAVKAQEEEDAAAAAAAAAAAPPASSDEEASMASGAESEAEEEVPPQ